MKTFKVIYKFKKLKCVGMTIETVHLPKLFKVHSAFTRNESWFFKGD